MHTYFQIRSNTSRAADLGQWRGGDAAVVDLLEKKKKSLALSMEQTGAGPGFRDGYSKY